MKTFKEFTNEVAEISYAKVMQRIKDGAWESDQDVVVGKLISINVSTGKKRDKRMIRVVK